MIRPGNAIRREAADWVVVLQQDHGVASGELEGFRRWLMQSPAHVEAYLSAETAWLAMQSIDRNREIDVGSLMRESTNVVALRPLSGSMSGPPDFARDSSGRRGGAASVRRIAVAGLALILLLAPLLWFLLPAGIQLETALGEQHTSVMDDDSVIEINTESELRVNYTNSIRRVELLTGEAYFNVRSDAERPFVVAVDDLQVVAVGTEFNVRRKAGTTVVTVAEGVIELIMVEAGAADGVRLEAGQQATIADDGADVVTNAVRVDQAVAWRRGQLVCLGETLQSVVEEINRYNQRKIVIDDDELRGRRISGVFSVHSPELVVEFLERSGSVSIAESADGTWVLSLPEGARDR